MLPRMGILSKKGLYEGPVCFVDRDHLSPDGKQLYGGWHYATKLWPTKAYVTKAGKSKKVRVLHEIPDAARPLHLDDLDPDSPFYEYAESHHQSWVEKHGPGNIVLLGGE